ncbi:MAG: glycosyltransferase family 4 protein [Lentimicrobium sp.]
MKATLTKKHIIHLMGYQSLKFGILEKFVISIAKQAREENIEIIFVYSNKPRSKEFTEELEKADIKYYFTDSSSIISYWKIFYKLTKKYKPIVLHSHFLPLLSGFYGWVLGYKHRWVTVHLMLINKDIREVISKKELKLTSRIYRMLINIFTTRFFCVSKAVYNQYVRIYPHLSHKLQVLHNGVSVIPFSKKKSREMLGFNETTIYICSIVFAAKIKGIDVLLKAFKSLINKYDKREIKLCIIGLSDARLKTLKTSNGIDEFDLQDKIINFGIIDNVPDVLPAMDIYVQPSRSEALPYAIIEAGLFEIPAIGSNVGGIPELIINGETGFLFCVEDHEELAEKLIFLSENESLRNEMGVNSRKHKIENFKMEKNLDVLIAQYKQVLFDDK